MDRQSRNNLILLIGIVLHNLTYPMATMGGLGSVLFFAIYCFIFIFGVWALSENMGLRGAVISFGVLLFASAIINLLYFNKATEIGVPVLSIGYHGVMIYVLAAYIFRSHHIQLSVVLAATSLYLVIGSAYAAIYNLIETISPGSFVLNSGADASWQEFIYYSYVTLTTLGYGDIAPVRFYAQSISAFEAVTGVLYTVLLLARLVGAYARRNADF